MFSVITAGPDEAPEGTLSEASLCTPAMSHVARKQADVFGTTEKVSTPLLLL